MARESKAAKEARQRHAYETYAWAMAKGLARLAVRHAEDELLAVVRVPASTDMQVLQAVARVRAAMERVQRITESLEEAEKFVEALASAE